MPVPASRRDARGRARPDAGQSTVEFALVLPLLFAFLALLVQVALVARDEIEVVNAARNAAREAAVTADPQRVGGAAARALPGARVTAVQRGAVGAPVTVEVAYVAKTDLPLVGVLLPDLTLRARAVMTVER